MKVIDTSKTSDAFNRHILNMDGGDLLRNLGVGKIRIFENSATIASADKFHKDFLDFELYKCGKCEAYFDEDKDLNPKGVCSSCAQGLNDK